MPPMDPGNSSWLEVVNVTWDGEWTSVTFLREGQGNDLSVSVLWGSTLWAAAVTCQTPTFYADCVG